MNFQVYILYSYKRNRFYFGYTGNILHRLKEHNTKESSFTAIGIPWILLWASEGKDKEGAEILERKLKNLSQKRKLNFMGKYPSGIINPEQVEELKIRIK